MTVVVGAESTGTTTMAQALARLYRLRDREANRQWMTGRFRTEVRASGVPHLVLSGSCPQRLRAAVAATDALPAAGWTFAPPLSATGSPPIGG